jgi:AcrR family transcriptional regulator
MPKAAAKQQQGRRGRPPATSREEIAEAALRLAREGGLEAITIRKLAEAMGRAPMTLYNHSLTKDEIVDLMVATALQAFDYVPDPEAPWREQMHAGFLGLFDTLRDNPVIIELLVSPKALIGPALDHTRDTLLAVMKRSTLDPQQAVNVFNTIGAYVVGAAAVESGRARRAEELAAHLKTLPRDEYPALADSPTAWAESIPRAMLEQGLRLLIDGLTGDATMD